MKIYKFKDLTDEKKQSHFLQIILQNTIWCSRPDSLNDEDEFKFKLDYQPSPNTAQLLADVVAQYRTTSYAPPHVSATLALKNKKLESIAAPIINELVHKCRTTIGITSFSLTNSDDYLWEEYGGKGNGAFVEINIPDHLVGQSYHRVQYVSDKIFHVDSFLESALFPGRAFKIYQNILLTKTKTWSQEEEIRFIGNRQDVSLIFDGYISEVTFGPRVPADTLNQLTARITNHCSANNIKITNL
jgi:hypothetical protein